jgi:hypothetical protein
LPAFVDLKNSQDLRSYFANVYFRYDFDVFSFTQQKKGLTNDGHNGTINLGSNNMAKLPNAKNAIIPVEKFTKYALDSVKNPPPEEAGASGESREPNSPD